MKRIIYSFVVALVVLGAAESANASLFSAALSHNGKRDTLLDESIGIICDIDGDGKVSEGDVVQNIARFFEVDPDGSNNSTSFNGNLWGITSMEITGFDVDASGDFVTVTLGKIVDPDADDYKDKTIKSILETAGIVTTGVTLSDDTVLAVVESATESFGLDAMDATGGFVTAAGVGTKLDGDWSTTLIANLEREDDFHELKVDLTGLVGDPTFDPTDISDLEAGTSATGADKEFADYRSAFSVEDTNFFAEPADFLDILVNDTSGTSHESHIVTSGNNIISAFNTTNDEDFLDKGWHFGDDGNFDINSTPEPATLAVWATIGGIAGVYARRRRKARKA